MAVFLEKFSQIKAAEKTGLVVGLFDASMQKRRPELIALLIGQTAFISDLSLMNRGVLEPLLPVGQAVPPLVDHHCRALWQVIEQ